jgi:autotransporter translocation and assembly factor TamB
VDFDRVAIEEWRVDLPGGGMRVHQAALDYEELVFTSATHSPPVYVTGSLPDPRPLSEGLFGVPIGGDASFRVSMSGPVNTPSGHLVADITEPSAPVEGRRVQGASAALDVSLNQGVLRVREGRFDSELGSLRIDGQAELYEKVDTFIGELWRARSVQPLDLSMRVSDLDLGAINSLFELERGLSGFLTASLAVGGTVQRPEAAGSLEMASGTVMNATVSGATLGFEADGQRFLLEHGSVGIGGGRVTGSGSYRWNTGDYTVDLGIRGLQLGALAPLNQAAGRFAPGGRVDATMEGDGSLTEPSLGGAITLRDATIGGWQLGDTALTVYGGETSIHVAGSAVSLATLHLEVPIAEPGPLHAKIGLSHLELGNRFPEISRLEAVDRLAGTGSIEIFAARDLSTYNVVTRLDRVAVQTPARTFRNRGPLVVAINHRGVVQFEEFALGARGEFIEVRGGVRLDPLLLDLRMEGELDLRLLDVVGPYLVGEAYRQSVGRVEGRATVDASFRGVPTRPIADGKVAFGETEVHLRDVAEPVVVDGGRLALSRQKIQISEESPIRGEVLGGSYRVTGEMGLDRFRPTRARLDVWSHNLQYRLEDTANVTFDTDVTLSAEDVFRPETYLVSGTIDVLDGRYYRDMSLVNQQITGRVIDAFSGRTRRYQANPLAQMPALRKIAFDLQIRARDGFLIQSRVDRFQLDLELRVDVRLQQTLNDPRVTGEVKVIDGAVGFQGERFEVAEGTMTYRGSFQNPRINLRAGADIENRCVDTRQVETLSTSLSFAGDFDREQQSTYRIILNAEGPLDNMDVAMESNPYADQRDILSLMLTGCTVDELTASSASQPTLEIALGPLLGRIEKQVKDVVELSEFSIMPGVERTELRIGDDVTQRLRWNFQLDTGMSEQAGGQRYQLEYRLSERWSAEFSERSLNETDNLLLDMRLKYRVPLGE